LLTTCGAGLVASSWALTFCNPAVSDSICFAGDGIRFQFLHFAMLRSYWIGFTKFAHTPGDLLKQIAGLKFEIIFVEIGHSQARTGFRLNHVNVVVIDNSVRFDIVPKI